VVTLNALCPYYTMYPLDFPLRVLANRIRPQEWVLDPFCGRGTTNFAARLVGLSSVGIDSSPIAVAQERSCKPYISLPATGMRAVRISPDSASVM
jgi:hypothetical protein